MLTLQSRASDVRYRSIFTSATRRERKANFDAYGPGGFYDAVAVRSGTVAKRYLSLDQAMIMGAIGNDLARDVLKRAFVTPQFERVVRPLLAAETFNVPAGQPLPQLGKAAGR